MLPLSDDFHVWQRYCPDSLPIVSYNYGKGNQDRIRQTLHISAGLSVGLGLVMTTIGILLAPQIVNLFIDGTSPANAIGHAGLPLFLTSSLPFTVNVVLIGYLQSLERYKAATFFMLLRASCSSSPASSCFQSYLATQDFGSPRQ